jgi:hypothetical protein
MEKPFFDDPWKAEAEKLAKSLGIRQNLYREFDIDINKVRSDITEALSPHFPRCRPFVFGSRLVGLAFPDSDVDLYLDFCQGTNIHISNNIFINLFFMILLL